MSSEEDEKDNVEYLSLRRTTRSITHSEPAPNLPARSNKRKRPSHRLSHGAPHKQRASNKNSKDNSSASQGNNSESEEIEEEEAPEEEKDHPPTRSSRRHSLRSSSIKRETPPSSSARRTRSSMSSKESAVEIKESVSSFDSVFNSDDESAEEKPRIPEDRKDAARESINEEESENSAPQDQVATKESIETGDKGDRVEENGKETFEEEEELEEERFENTDEHAVQETDEEKEPQQEKELQTDQQEEEEPQEDEEPPQDEETQEVEEYTDEDDRKPAAIPTDEFNAGRIESKRRNLPFQIVSDERTPMYAPNADFYVLPGSITHKVLEKVGRMNPDWLNTEETEKSVTEELNTDKSEDDKMLNGSEENGNTETATDATARSGLESRGSEHSATGASALSPTSKEKQRKHQYCFRYTVMPQRTKHTPMSRFRVNIVGGPHQGQSGIVVEEIDGQWSRVQSHVNDGTTWLVSNYDIRNAEEARSASSSARSGDRVPFSCSKLFSESLKQFL